MPVAQRDLARVALVLVENAGVRFDPLFVENVEVRLFVQGEGTIIQIGGADGGPAIVDEQILTVETRRLIFVKPRACFEQRLPARLADGSHHSSIGVGAGRDDLHAHAAAQRFDQRAPAEVVRNEIGVGDADDLARGRDRNEQHQARAVGSFAGGAFERLAKMLSRRLDFRKVIVAVEQLRAGLEPIVHERLLQLRDGGAFHSIMRVAPQTARAAVAPPIVRDADSANESELPVDDQDFAVRPKVDSRKVDETKNLHVHARAPEQPDGAAAHAVAPESILEEMHRHPGARPFRQRLRELVGDFAFAKEKILERDRPFRGANGVQHGGENLVPILQDRDFVPFEQGRPEHVAHGADEGVVAGMIIRGDAIPDLLFRREEIPGNEKSGEAAGRGSAEDFGPLRRLTTKRKLHCNSIEDGRLSDCPREEECPAYLSLTAFARKT